MLTVKIIFIKTGTLIIRFNRRNFAIKMSTDKMLAINMYPLHLERKAQRSSFTRYSSNKNIKSKNESLSTLALLYSSGFVCLLHYSRQLPHCELSHSTRLFSSASNRSDSSLKHNGNRDVATGTCCTISGCLPISETLRCSRRRLNYSICMQSVNVCRAPVEKVVATCALMDDATPVTAIDHLDAKRSNIVFDAFRGDDLLSINIRDSLSCCCCCCCCLRHRRLNSDRLITVF